MKAFQKSETGETELYIAELEKGTRNFFEKAHCEGALRNTQLELESRIGINYSTFTKSIVLGQNIVSNFISGGKDQRRQIIEEALGLEKFDLYHGSLFLRFSDCFRGSEEGANRRRATNGKYSCSTNGKDFSSECSK